MKVLIIGLGSIAKKHVDALRKISSELEFYALRHKVTDESDGIKNIYSYGDLEQISFDFAVISNSTLFHSETIQKIKHLNIPLFIEKPVFNEVSLVNENLVKELIEKNNSTYVACNLRFLEGMIKMKEILKDKRIEEVNSYCGSYLPDWRENKDYKNIYSAKKSEGGGVELDLIHELDYLYWIFGQPECSHSVFKSNSSLDIDSTDYANYLLDYGDFCANVILNYYRKDAKRTFEVLTSEGTYLLNLKENKIYFNNELIFESDQTILDTYKIQMKFFIENKVLKNSNFNNIDEAYKILKLCLGKD